MGVVLITRILTCAYVTPPFATKDKVPMTFIVSKGLRKKIFSRLIDEREERVNFSFSSKILRKINKAFWQLPPRHYFKRIITRCEVIPAKVRFRT